MLLALVALSSTLLPAVALRSDDPPVHVWLDPDAYVTTGDRMRVHLRAAADGYVIVLRADAQGRVRVLFPLDPTDDAFVRGGKTFEVRSRGDREAFSVDDASGTGTVLAAWSASPFKTDAYALNGHWDYRVLAAQRVADDPEAGLVDLANSMAGDNHFDYDVATYTLGSDSRVAYGSRYAGYDPLYDPYFASCWGCGPWGWGGYGGYGWRFGFGTGYGCDPWYCDPFYYPGGYYPGGFIFTYASQPRPGWFMQPRSWGPGRAGPRAFTFRPNSPPFVLPRSRVRQRTAGAGAEPRSRMWNPPPPVIERPRRDGSGSDGNARPATRPEPKREARPSSPPPRREARPSAKPSSPPPRRDSGGHEGGGRSSGGGGGRRKP